MKPESMHGGITIGFDINRLRPELRDGILTVTVDAYPGRVFNRDLEEHVEAQFGRDGTAMLERIAERLLREQVMLEIARS